jgi:predicted phage tail protein
MGLSEREQQLLDDMERRLYQSEADVLKTPVSTAQFNLRSLVLGILVILAGVGTLVAGVGLQLLLLGLLGFALMLGGTLLAFSKREQTPSVDASSQNRAQGSQSQSGESLSDRMNRRWDERMGGDR